MLLKQDFELMARYNRWMNERLYDAASQLDPEQLRADRGAFFGSILATLQHILAADTHWMKRFAAHAPPLVSLEPVRAMPLPPLVRAMTFPDFAQLKDDRRVMDAVIVAFVDEATDAMYARPLTYTNTAGDTFTRTFGLLVRHFFNHQTHHRGQITTLFSQYGVDVGVTDLSALIPEVKQDES